MKISDILWPSQISTFFLNVGFTDKDTICIHNHHFFYSDDPLDNLFLHTPNKILVMPREKKCPPAYSHTLQLWVQ